MQNKLKIRLDPQSWYGKGKGITHSRSIADAFEEFKKYSSCLDDYEFFRRYEFSENGMIVDEFEFDDPDKVEFKEDDGYGYGPYILVQKGNVYVRVSTIDEIDHSKQNIRYLEEKLRRQKKDIRAMQESLEHKNKALDALHWVWCSGGCEGGVHRYTEEKLTEEIVKIAEFNTERLRTWFDSKRYRDEYDKKRKKKSFIKKLLRIE